MSRSCTPIKVVFDCMIFLQATANQQSPAANALDLIDTGEIKLYVSEPILEEVGKVLNRPEVRTALPQITDVRIEALFRRLEKEAVMVRHVPRLFEYSRAPFPLAFGPSRDLSRSILRMFLSATLQPSLK